MWCSRLRIWHCHCSGSGHCYGMGWIPGLETSHALGMAKKKENYNKGKRRKLETWHDISKLNLDSSCFMLTIFFSFRRHRCSRLGVESELQLPTYATATEMPDMSLTCDLHHSLQQCWILDPLSKARDKPTSSWIVVGFVSAEPQWEVLFFLFK